MSDKVITGAVALIKSRGKVIGKMKSVRYQEQIRRLRVGGLGTIMPLEQTPVEWDATLNCDFMTIDLNISSIPGAIDRNFSNSRSQVLLGKESFEDNIVLESLKEPVQLDIFRKVSDLIDSFGKIKPKLEPFAIITSIVIDADSFDLSEGAISSRQQSFKVMEPLILPNYMKS